MKASSKSSAHTRFIPREEIDGCSARRFSAMVGSEDAPAAVAETSEPGIDGPAAEALHEIRERAHAEGYALGHAAGGQEVRDALEATVRKTAEETAVRMAQLLHNTKEHLQKSEEQISRHILELACDLARQVVRQELQCNTQHLRPVITEALAQLVDDGLPATVRMNPGDLALMKGALQETLTGNRPEFVADNNISAGGCLVESASTGVDASIEKRWLPPIANLGLSSPWNPENADV